MKFVNVCETIKREQKIALPPEASRAIALMAVMDGDFNKAVTAAERIGVGETQSVVLRDLAKRAVYEGHCAQALHLAVRITHGRSQHLPDIGREIVNVNNRSDATHLHRLARLCSAYSDASYRIVSSLIRFNKPEPDILFSMLCECGVLSKSEL